MGEFAHTHLLLYPNLNEYDNKIINNLELIAHKKLDTFGCSSEHNYILITSNRDISNCLKLFKATKTKLICHLRQIQITSNNQQPCNNFQIEKKSIAIELNPNLILLRTLLNNITIICGNKTDHLHIKEEYSKISINHHCSIIGADFKISGYNHNQTIFNVETSIEHLSSHIPNPYADILPLKSRLNNFSTKVFKDINNLNNNISELKVLREKTNIDIRELTENQPSTKNTSLIISITVASTLLTLIIIMIVMKICKRKSKAKKFVLGSKSKPKNDQITEHSITPSSTDRSPVTEQSTSDTLFPTALNPLKK